MHEYFGQPSWAPTRRYAITCNDKSCSMGHLEEFGTYYTEDLAIKAWDRRCKEVRA